MDPLDKKEKRIRILHENKEKEILMEKIPEGTVVTSSLEGGTLIGEICGIANELPVVGYIYIIKITNRFGKILEEYPYSCIVLPRSCFQIA